MWVSAKPGKSCQTLWKAAEAAWASAKPGKTAGMCWKAPGQLPQSLDKAFRHSGGKAGPFVDTDKSYQIVLGLGDGAYT